MSVLLERENDAAAQTSQEDETLPECLRAYQPFVLLWSEKRHQENQERNWEFSDSYHGIGIAKVDCTAHDHIGPTRDDSGSGTYFTDTFL